jgi:hypothetical protein
VFFSFPWHVEAPVLREVHRDNPGVGIDLGMVSALSGQVVVDPPGRLDG